MKLLIGLYRSQPGWEIVLQQEGLQYEIIKLEKSISIESYSVIIINDVLDNEQCSRVKDFTQKWWRCSILIVGLCRNNEQQVPF